MYLAQMPVHQSNEPLSGLVIRLVYLQRSLCTGLVYMLTFVYNANADDNNADDNHGQKGDW